MRIALYGCRLLFFGTNADAAAVSSCTVSGITAKTYTGSAVKQNPTVKYKNKVLRNGIDYTVSYQNNKNAGTAYVIIKGKGSYSGTIKNRSKSSLRSYITGVRSIR